MFHHHFLAGWIEQEASVSVILVIGKDVLRTGLAHGFLQAGLRALQLGPQAEIIAVLVMQQHLHGNGPDSTFIEHVLLLQEEMVDAALCAAGPIYIHLRHAAPPDPDTGPVFE